MEEDTLVNKLGMLGGRHDEEVDDETVLLEQGGYRPFIASRQAYRPAVMLDVVLRSGESVSFAYTHLYKVVFTTNRKVRLVFSEDEVTVSGIQLGELYRRLQLQRVLQITEADRPTIERARDGQCVVTGIEIVAIGEGEDDVHPS